MASSHFDPCSMSGHRGLVHRVAPQMGVVVVFHPPSSAIQYGCVCLCVGVGVCLGVWVSGCLGVEVGVGAGECRGVDVIIAGLVSVASLY